MDNSFIKCSKIKILLSLEGMSYSTALLSNNSLVRELVKDGFVEVTDISCGGKLVHRNVCLLTCTG